MSPCVACGGRLVATRGQALIESLLLLLVLVPLAIAIGQLTQLSSLQHELLGRLRSHAMFAYFAPEEASALREEILDPRAMVIANAHLLLGGDAPPAIEYEWAESTSDRPESSVDEPTLDVRSPAALALELVALLEPLGPGAFGLAATPASRVQAKWPIEFSSGIARWIKQDAWALRESLVLLPDTWVAPNKEIYAKRIAAITVSGRLAELSTPTSVIKNVLSVIEPSFERFCPGRQALDIVPEDRLVNSRLPHNDLRQEDCDARE